MTTTIEFCVKCDSEWGQNLFLILRNSANNEQRIELYYSQKNEWKREIEIDQLPDIVGYRYAIYENGEQKNIEPLPVRSLPEAENYEKIVILDEYKRANGNSIFESKLFTNCLLRREKNENFIEQNGNIHIRIAYPNIANNHKLILTGNQELAGNWDTKMAIELNDEHFPYWECKLKSEELNFPLEYKFVVVEQESGDVVAWEKGNNRRIERMESNNLFISTAENLCADTKQWKCAGVSIPIFSLRSEKSFGIGEFSDLKLMVDWAKKSNQHIIQTLPINDTISQHSDRDSYPYNAISVFALHPIYLNLEAMGRLKLKKDREYFERKREEFNAKSFSDYQNVLNEKWKYFQLIYKQNGQICIESEAFKEFMTKNSDWLIPYAAFSTMRDLEGSANFQNWSELSIYDSETVYNMTKKSNKRYKNLMFFCYLQFHLHCQLTEAHDYATENGVALKSDIPIGVSPQSVDAWLAPQLFNREMQAGAPPDDFSTTGQNWGFPTYNWEIMANDNYQWWNRRFSKFEEYFDAYRIDHILGFFRIWEIPATDVWALNGSFYPAMPLFPQDIEQRGLKWLPNRYSKPYIKSYMLKEIFGDDSEKIASEFLEYEGENSYHFLPKYSTQRDIEKQFGKGGKPLTAYEQKLRDGLYELHSEVLFVRDNRNPNMFHPRISLHSTRSFQDLPEKDKRIIDQLYVDFFYHRHNEFWKNSANSKLPAIKRATTMLACGEDLGMVPASVAEVLNSCEILSLEIERMPKDPNQEFALPKYAPYHSVCTTSTHDMSPIRAWWNEDRETTQRYYNHALSHSGNAPSSCTAEIATEIINEHLLSSAMLVILPWQDWLAIDANLRASDENSERINIPSNPFNFWCYRMHITLEELLKADELNRRIAEMITNSNR